MIHYRTFILWIGIAILLCVSGCTENTTNIPDDDNGYANNRPPKILLWGPTYDSLAHFKDHLPQLWLIVGDPDGSNDIAAVILKISKINIVSLIVRPDDAGQECSTPYYSPNDTINILPYLKKQTFVAYQALQKSSNGVYMAYLYYSLLTNGGIVNDGDVFGQVVKPCRSGLDYLYMLEQFGLYPPAISSPRDVYVTYAEFFISGISITVYDQSGATATVTFPDFYGIFSNTAEDQTLP